MTTTPDTALYAGDITELIVTIYRTALGDDSLDAASDFFESGGDSLSAFQITAGLRDAVGVDVPVALVFAYPSPADLATVVDVDRG